jgi:hypothetical protein
MHDDYRRSHDDRYRRSAVMMVISRVTVPPSASGDNATRSGKENGHTG